MKKLEDVDYIHWLAVEMSAWASLSLEQFKRSNNTKIRMWRTLYPLLADHPPIYWHKFTRKWVWLDIPTHHIKEYRGLCERMINLRIK